MTQTDPSAKQKMLDIIGELLQQLPDDVVASLAEQWEQMVIEQGWIPGAALPQQLDPITDEESGKRMR